MSRGRIAPHPKGRSKAKNVSRRLLWRARNARRLSVGQGKEVGGKRCGKRAACGDIAALSGRRAGPSLRSICLIEEVHRGTTFASTSIFQSARHELGTLGAERRAELMIEIRDTNAVVKGSFRLELIGARSPAEASRHANLSASRCPWSP